MFSLLGILFAVCNAYLKKNVVELISESDQEKQRPTLYHPGGFHHDGFSVASYVIISRVQITILIPS